MLFVRTRIMFLPVYRHNREHTAAQCSQQSHRVTVTRAHSSSKTMRRYRLAAAKISRRTTNIMRFHQRYAGHSCQTARWKPGFQHTIVDLTQSARSAVMVVYSSALHAHPQTEGKKGLPGGFVTEICAYPNYTKMYVAGGVSNSDQRTPT